MTEAETAWLAGILEGEGCFDANSNGRCPRIRLEMTDEDVVRRVAELVGGVVTVAKRINPKWADSYRLHIGARAGAVRVMLAIRPWMGKRRQQKIDEVLTCTRQEDVL